MPIDFNDPKETKKYIESVTKQKVDADDNAGIKKTVIDHKCSANSLIKYINAIPDMPPMSKKVMTLKLINPGMTCLQISMSSGIPFIRILQYEDEGKEIVKKYLDGKMSIQDGINRFNKSEFGLMDVEKLRLPKGNAFNIPSNNANPNDIEKLA